MCSSLLSVVVQAQVPEYAPCLRLEGVIVDYNTRKVLPSANLFVKLPGGQKKVSTSSAQGKFSMNAPCEATAVVIEKQGYRTQVLPIANTQADTHTVVVEVPLLAVEQPGKDRIYLQTEQKAYVQASRVAEVKQVDSTEQHAVFTLSDAISKTPVEGKICFVFTKTGERNCLKTDKAGQVAINFSQTDIVAIDATAQDYQPYAGNLLVESLGASTKQIIQLQRELTLLTVWADKADQGELLGKGVRIPLKKVTGPRGDVWFSSYRAKPGSYTLIIKQQRQTRSEEVNVRSGLTVRYIDPSKSTAKLGIRTVETGIKPNAATPVSLPALVLPDSIPMLYFEQGSYQLRADSQEVLKQVALYLKTHPHYRLQVTGHTDNVGNERLNESLSEYRAAVAFTFLTRQGIPEDKLNKAGEGSRNPISPNDTEANKALNRRVALKLITNQ